MVVLKTGAKNKNAAVVVLIMPLILLAATTFGFASHAGATSSSSTSSSSSSSALVASKSTITSTLNPPPSTAAKILSHRNYHHQHHHHTTTTVLNASPPSTSNDSVDDHSAVPNGAETFNGESEGFYHHHRDQNPTDNANTDANADIPANTETNKKLHSSLRGEHQSNILSRLFYFYASQLLKISSKRELTVDDALPTPDNILMDRQVPQLQRTYDICRQKAYKHLETLKSYSCDYESSLALSLESNNGIENGGNGNNTRERSDGNASSTRRKRRKKLKDRISKSESLILVKALLLHQKKNLILTGTLVSCHSFMLNVLVIRVIVTLFKICLYSEHE